MEIPTPDQVPSRRIRGYLANLRDAILGVRPIAGAGITISEFPGQGTVIATTDSSNTCLPTNPPASGTYVWGSVDGVCGWISTTTCS